MSYDFGQVLKKLNLAHLKYFYDAGMCNSISKAAARNYVTQPTISAAIVSLERILGLQLTTHSRNKFKLTDDGERLVEHIKPLLKNFYDFIQEEHLARDELKGTLKIGVTRAIMETILLFPLKKFSQQHPKLTLDIVFGSPEKLMNKLNDDEIELAILVDNFNYQGLTSFNLYQGDFGLYCSAQGTQKLRADGAQHELKFLISGDEIEVTRLKDFYQNKFNKKLPVLIKMKSWSSIAFFIVNEFGIGLLPDLFCNFCHMGKKLYPCYEDFTVKNYNIVGLYDAGKYLSVNTKVFSEYLKGHFCSSTSMLDVQQACGGSQLYTSNLLKSNENY